MQSNFFIDIHCHPSIKAYAKSYKTNPGVQSANPRHESSVWRHDRPSLFDKLKNYIATLTNFIQSDGTSLLKGRVSIVCLSFYPQEKGFFDNKLGKGLPADLLTKLATEFGQQRIDAIQAFTSYWEDLLKEMNFLLQLENKKVKIEGGNVSYRIARSYEDIEITMRNDELGESVIIFVPTIEGLHIFDQVMDSNEDWKKHPKGVADNKMPQLLQRAELLRKGSDTVIRPVFVTFAHHFWNGLCGHEASLGNLVKCAVDQVNGFESGLTEAGKCVIEKLIGDMKDEHGTPVKLVPIDIKHMNRRSRLEYFQLLNNEYSGKNIPVLCSHGSVNGLSDSENNIRQTTLAKEFMFNESAINMYDDELLIIERTGGVIGLQLDERRIASKVALRAVRGSLGRREMLYQWSRLVWNQVRHIAEYLDMNERYAWCIQCIGTDFDGIVDPINGYWTSESLDDLDDYLLKHAYNYLKGIKEPCPLLQPHNKMITPEEVVDRVMTGNALGFLSRIF